MPPPDPEVAAWFNPFLRAISFGAPLLMLAWMFVRRRSWTRWQAAISVGAGAVAMLLLQTVGWHIDPDYADSPRAAVASTLIMTVPALASTAAVWLFGQRKEWRTPVRVLLSVLAGYGMMALCVIPALVTFVSLGGDTL